MLQLPLETEVASLKSLRSVLDHAFGPITMSSSPSKIILFYSFHVFYANQYDKKVKYDNTISPLENMTFHL